MGGGGLEHGLDPETLLQLWSHLLSSYLTHCYFTFPFPQHLSQFLAQSRYVVNACRSSECMCVCMND
jgi:hypothetical protein